MKTLIERGFNVNVSQEQAWQHLAKVTTWPTWAKHIRHIELKLADELGFDTSGTIYLSNGMRTTFKMTEFNPIDNWKWTGPFLWLTVHYDHLFLSVDDNTTEITFKVVAEGWGVGIFGRVFAMIYNRNLNVAIPNLIAEMDAM